QLAAVEPWQALRGHAVLAAEVAAVGDGDTQVADQAAVSVLERPARIQSHTAKSRGAWPDANEPPRHGRDGAFSAQRRRLKPAESPLTAVFLLLEVSDAAGWLRHP